MFQIFKPEDIKPQMPEAIVQSDNTGTDQLSQE
jgi:hypothetical protein